MAAYKDEARGTWYVSFHYNSKADSWIFMLIAHGYAPFDFAVAAGVIDNLTATGIYSL